MADAYEEYVPELGAIVAFPRDVSLEKKREFIQRTLASRNPATAAAPAPPPPSSTAEDILRNVGGFALGVPRGIIEGVAAVPEGIGGITGSELAKATGQAIRDNPLANLFAGEASTGRMAGELVGNLATFLAPGAVAKLAGAPRLATTLAAVMGGAGGAAEQVREAAANRQAGMTVSPGQEQLAALAGSAVGLADLIPFGRLTRTFAPGLAGAAQIAGEGIGAQAARIAGSAAIGGATEGAQRGLQNLVEQQIYNPQQDALEGVVQEAGIGAVAEGGLDGLIGFLTKRVAAKGLRAKQQRVQEGPSPTVGQGQENAIGIETTAEGLPSVRFVERQRPALTTRGTFADEGVRGSVPPDTSQPATAYPGYVPLPPSSTYTAAGRVSPTVSPTLSPEDLAFAQDLAGLNQQQPTAPFPPESTPIANLLMEDLGGAGEFTPSGRFIPAVDPLAPSLFRDRPREMRGTGAPLSASQEIPQAPLASIAEMMQQPYLQDALARQRVESQRLAESQAVVDQLLAAQRAPVPEPAPAPSRITEPFPPIRPAVPPEPDRAAARPQAEADRITARTESEATRAARRTQSPVVPETGVPNEIALDAQQRLSREEFGKNLTELNPDELAIVQAKQESGLGSAVRPQELADVREFADLPFTRDQYRQALEIGKPGGTATLPSGLTTPKRIAQTLDVPIGTAERMVETMIRRGDADANADQFSPQPAGPSAVRIREDATGPRYSVEPPATATTTPEPITVEAFRQRIVRGDVPEVPLQIHAELKNLGVDDLVSARLVDSLGRPDVAGQYANRIVSLALAGKSPEQLRSTLNHEVVHALKELGIFSNAEWNLLQNTLTPGAVLSDDERKTYGDLYKNDPQALAEEAVARGMQKYIDGRMDLPRPAAAAVEKTTSVFSKLGDLFRQRGLETPEQVIGAFRAGEIGRRQLPGNAPTVAATRQPNTADTTNLRDLEALLGKTDSEGYAIPENETTPRLSIEQEPVPNPFFAPPEPGKSIAQAVAEKLQLRPSLPSEARTAAIDSRAPFAKLARAAGTIGKAEISSEEAVRRLDVANDQAIANLKFGALKLEGKAGNGYFIASEGPHPLGSDGYMTRMAEAGKLDKFFHYLAGLRSTALGEREKELTPARIRQYLSYGNEPGIKQAAAEHKQFNDGMVDAVVASGRFSKEEGERLKRDMYIPYLRISETPEGDVRFTAGGPSLASIPKLKALKGELGQARDPLATYVENVQMLTTMALKNEAMNRVSRDGIQTGYMRPARKGDENTVQVWVNGQKKRMAVLDKELYESVTYAPQPLSDIIKLLAIPADALRASVVFSPIYPIRNLIRDSQQVFAQGYTDMPIISALDGVRKALTRSESFRDLERFGVVSSNIRGEGGGEGTAREARAMLDSSLLGAVSKGIRAFEDFNQRFESANRIVVYENLLKKGYTKAQAASEARELVNFNRHGANVIMRSLSALIPFQNARIQGADVLYRGVTTKDNPAMRRQLYTRGAMLAALSMTYAAAIQNNPAYRSASEEEQENNWFVPLPDGGAIRVPIPFELGWFVKVVPEKMAQLMNGTADGKAFFDSFIRFMNSTMKIDVVPQAVKPFAEAKITNYDSFRGKNVEPNWMKRLEVADRYDERTTDVAKAISEYSNGVLSPIQADHMLRGYSGTSMNYLWQMIDFATNPQASPSLESRQAAEMPVVGTLFARKDGGRKLAEAYEIRDLAEQAAASLRMRLREGTAIEAPERERLTREAGFDQAIEPINQALTALNQRERALRRDVRMGRVTGTQAKPELDNIRARKIELSERVLEIRKRMVPGG
jgi:hypothetical protein